MTVLTSSISKREANLKKYYEMLLYSDANRKSFSGYQCIASQCAKTGLSSLLIGLEKLHLSKCFFLLDIWTWNGSISDG